MEKRFEEFIKSDFGLEIWLEKKLIFRSKEEGIKGLLKFLKKYGRRFKNLIVFDKKVGNAIVLLCAYLKVKEIYGAVGSETAEKTLKRFKIKLHFLKTIPNILNKTETDICPFEKLSFSKTPEEFYNLVKVR